MENLSLLFDTGKKHHINISFEAYEDLNINSLIDIILKEKQIYDLKNFYLSPIYDTDTIYYRQSVLKDIEKKQLLDKLENFSNKMIIVHRYLEFSKKLNYSILKKSWLLESILIYCNTVSELTNFLQKFPLESKGLIKFSQYFLHYINSDEFIKMYEYSKETKKQLSKIKYCLIIDSGKISVKSYEDEEDYSKYINATFSRFEDEDSEEKYDLDYTLPTGTSHIDAIVLEYLAKLYPKTFEMIDKIYESYKHFLDSKILNFEKEIQFYISYLEFIDKLTQKNLCFCYPLVSNKEKQEFVEDSYDLFLASISEKPIVANSYNINEDERIIVVTGPNQGGKTSFARMFGLVHYFAALGLKVPAKSAKIFIPDKILTHFERQEDVINLKSKLEDDLHRMQNIINSITDKSLIIFNEVFSSTSLFDALQISKKIMDKIIQKDILGVWVTFLDDLSSYNRKIISMVAEVSEENPLIRTFKISRKIADGKAYAMAIAEKYNLTLNKIKQRIVR